MKPCNETLHRERTSFHVNVSHVGNWEVKLTIETDLKNSSTQFLKYECVKN